MISGKLDIKANDGKVATGRIQNGNRGRWISFSAEWAERGWSVGFTTGTEGIAPARLAQLALKVAESLEEPKPAT
jgi:hypothetical protein